MSDPASTSFGAADWVVLAFYFVVLAATGVLLSRREGSTHDYFLGGGRIPMWAAAVSFLATALSAATFIGGPQQSFAGDLTYLSATLGSILAVLIVAVFFVPAFYRHKVATVYGLLGKQFGPPAALAASIAFIIGRVFASGARLYIAAIPAALIIFGDLEWQHQALAIAGLAIVGSAYTLSGGIRTVIWTDVIQTFVFVGAAVAALVLLLQKIPVPVSEMITALSTAGPDQQSKLTVFRLGLDSPRQTYTILTAIFGFTLLNLGAYGTDHDLVQRTLTCRSAAKGSWSAITAILLSLPVTLVFMLIGLLLYIFYARPDLMGASAPAYSFNSSREVFLHFMLHELPPGMAGLMIAGLFAAGLSSITSTLNAMAASGVNDIYKRFRPGRSDQHYLLAGRLGVLAAALVLSGFALVSVFWQAAHPDTTLIDFALKVMLFAYSGLVAVFLTALFTRRGNNASVIAALVTGFGVVLLMQTVPFPTEPLSQQLAFPWQMLIATVLAFGTCCLGRPGTQSAPVRPALVPLADALPASAAGGE